MPPTRTTAALTAWARQLDRNWYPGEVGAEVGLDPEGAFVQPQPTQDPVEYGTEILTAYGPTGLRTPRTLIELSLRMGAMPGVQQAVAQADQYLGWLSQYAQATNQPALLQWAFLAGPHQREQRRDDHGEAGALVAQQQGGHEVDGRLAPPGALDDRAPPPSPTASASIAAHWSSRSVASSLPTSAPQVGLGAVSNVEGSHIGRGRGSHADCLPAATDARSRPSHRGKV